MPGLRHVDHLNNVFAKLLRLIFQALHIAFRKIKLTAQGVLSFPAASQALPAQPNRRIFSRSTRLHLFHTGSEHGAHKIPLLHPVSVLFKVLADALHEGDLAFRVDVDLADAQSDRLAEHLRGNTAAAVQHQGKRPHALL